MTNNIQIKPFITLLTLIFLLQFQSAMTQPWNWALTAGGTNSETGNAITVSPINTTWVLGSYKQTAIFNNDTLTAYGEEDMLLLNLSTSGQVIQAICGGSTSDDTMGDITSDSLGNVYVVGRYWDQAIFGTDTLKQSYGSSSALFLLKYNDLGQLLWAKSIEGNGLKWGQKLYIGPQGRLFLGGYFRNDLNIDQTIFQAAGITDSFIAEFDTTGNFLSIKTIGSQGVTRLSGFGFDANENLYVAGHFEGKLHFANDSIETLSSGFDVFALKYGVGGNPVWLKRAGGVFEDYCNDIIVDAQGVMTLVGNFFGVLEFDGFSLSTSGFNEDAYIARIDPSGNALWANSYGSTNNEIFTAVQHSTNKLYVSGHFFTQTLIGGTVFSTHQNETDGFLVTVLTDGTFEKADQVFGDGYDLFHDSAFAPDGSIYLIGEYETELIGGNTITSNGLYDLFVIKTNPLPVSVNEIRKPINFKLFPNPTSDFLQVELPKNRQITAVELHDTKGRLLLLQQVLPAQEFVTLDLFDMENGIFWLSLLGLNEQVGQKVIVIH